MNKRAGFHSTFPILHSTFQKEEATAPIPKASWFIGRKVGDDLLTCFSPGTLSQFNWLTADFLQDGTAVTMYTLTLREGEDGPEFIFAFNLLPQAQARLRLPLAAVNQNRWGFDREGALLQPMALGDRVDLHHVDRLKISLLHSDSYPSRWCMTAVTATIEEPPLLQNPILPQGPLLDGLGQSRLHRWRSKTTSITQMKTRLQSQLAEAPDCTLPTDFSRWGGWLGKQFDSSGFFRTHFDGHRWWLVDPDGYAFWSTGLDCVWAGIDAAYGGLEEALTWLPQENGRYKDAFNHLEDLDIPSVNYLAANFIRTFGPDDWYDNWTTITLSLLRQWGFNTVANWSHWKIARAAGVPYVRPLGGRFLDDPKLYRDFPDVFDLGFPAIAANFAEQLRETAADPAMIGYFLMNEPFWGFARETPAAGMLFNAPPCPGRDALANFLRQRYANDNTLAAAWGMQAATFTAITHSDWTTPLSPTAEADLEGFSEIMLSRFFGILSDACRAVAPNHLNLGIRYYTVPPKWAVTGMKKFDLFSLNIYKRRIPVAETKQISELLNMPVLVGEWHFGAPDVGLPHAGIRAVPDQKSRGQAYRYYLEDAAANPNCVGVHYFALYDQSAIGRYDGECGNIGFLDVCNRPYEEMVAAARTSHERIYQLAIGELEPFNNPPQYLPHAYEEQEQT